MLTVSAVHLFADLTVHPETNVFSFLILVSTGINYKKWQTFGAGFSCSSHSLWKKKKKKAENY